MIFVFRFVAVVSLILGLDLVQDSYASACPSTYGELDVNCDGELKISIVGDSLVVGFGDTQNKNKGGYVLRTAKLMPDAEFFNLGTLGLKTATLFKDLSKKLGSTTDNSTKTKIFDSDIVILDLGRNDRWLFGEPSETFQRLQRIAKLITKKAEEANLTPPLIVTAVLMLPNRGSQGPWVKDLNKLILKSSSAKYPADLRFDLVSKRLLSDDQIHPTPLGYRSLAATLQKYLIETLPAKIARAR